MAAAKLCGSHFDPGAFASGDHGSETHFCRKRAYICLGERLVIFDKQKILRYSKGKLRKNYKLLQKRKGDAVKILRKIRKTVLLLTIAAAFLLLPASQTEAATNYITQAKKNKVSTGKFVTNSKGIRYQYKNKKYAANKWHSINGKIYYFGSDSYARTGWFTYKKNTYYADTKGVVYVSRWLTQNGKKYYLKSNGIRAEKTWITKNGKSYYFDTKGVMAVRRQVSSGGKYYYVGSDGVKKVNCWVTVKDKKYFFGKNGVRYQGKWIKYKGKYYYFNKKNGVMATNSWVGDYYVGSDGARKTNCYVGNYYLDSTGKKIKALKFSGKYLIVGDSRTVGMDSAVSSSKAKFIGKVSMGYSWMKSTAGPKVKQYLVGNPDLKVVFAFGINDLGNISKYISYYKSLMKQFPDTKFYFLSVNPVDEKLASAKGYTVKNSSIKSFNTKLKSAFGSKYINTYSWLNKNGFSSVDGIHYTRETYSKLYNYIIKKIG